MQTLSQNDQFKHNKSILHNIYISIVYIVACIYIYSIDWYAYQIFILTTSLSKKGVRANPSRMLLNPYKSKIRKRRK